MTTNIKKMSDEELNRVCALAQGWSQFKGLWLIDKERSVKVDEYQPTANTVEGKAQCFDLMVKFRVNTPLLIDDVYIVYGYGLERSAESENPQRAICEAVALLEEEG